MNAVVKQIIDLRYTESAARMRFLWALPSHLRPGSADQAGLAEIMGLEKNERALLIAAFAVWLDEISYAWEKDTRTRQVEQLKQAASDFSLDYIDIYSARVHSGEIKKWLEVNLSPS